MSINPSYQETIDYLFGLQKHGVKLGLSNTLALMEIAGNPQVRFRTVHIAGTNGKGSTASFIANMLSAAGYRVGLYTSPHLVSFTERIRINGVPITEARVVKLAARIRDGYQGLKKTTLTPTFFEVTTALAFAYFAEESVDLAVVETGMGGRLDSTNVISPLVSVITNIDLEHTEFLGESLELIAAEKAGIIKPGVPVVTGAVQPEVLHVIQEQAEACAAPLHLLDRDFFAEHIDATRPQRFDYRGLGMTLKGLAVSLLGQYQIRNACLAIASIECLRRAGIAVPEEAVRAGLEQARWEGRLEQVARNPDIFLDGAHNPASARMLAGAITEMKQRYRRVVMVIGILGDKDVRGILTELVPLADRVMVTRPEYSRAMDLSALASEVRLLHPAVETTESVKKAIERAKTVAETGDLILITGSLYVVGDARAALALAGPNSLSGLKG